MGSCLSGDGTSAAPNSPSSTTTNLGKRKITARTRSGELRKEDLLHRIPGRKFLNGATGVASLFTKQGKKGINQDAMICWENFGSKADTIFCGVFDGHGPFGHMVAKKVRDSLPLRFTAQWELNSVNINNEGHCDINGITSGSTVEDEPTGKDLYEFQMLKECFLKAFRVMDKELKLHPTINSFCSGTTAVTLIKKGLDLVIGNVGDSRAVLGSRDEANSLIAVQLTIDLKPDLPSEAERIRKCKGRVFALQNEPDVSRVWLPNNNAPGLAMARALGDFCLKDFGLISVPEIYHHRLTEKDEFVVLATDGVWDVISNKEAVDIVASVPQECAARTLVETAVKAWRYKYPTSKVDDCAVVCLFLDSASGTLSTSESQQEEELTLDHIEINQEAKAARILDFVTS